MATRDGARFIPEQLQSFVDQTHDCWDLTVCDDGSRDATLELIDAFGRAHPERLAHAGPGPGRGAAANFLTLLARAAKDAPDAALAFSDQDDVWCSDKLRRAAQWLTAHGAMEGVPLVWTCRMTLTDAALCPLGESRRFKRPPAFGNALVQNILGGNTIVLSPAAARTLAMTVPAALEAGVAYHDWWTYQVLTGIGAQVYCDPEPLVLYRQHETNLLGYHGPLRGQITRFGMIWQGDYAGWIDANLTALRQNESLLTPKARRVLRGFILARRHGGARLAATLPRLGLYRQSAQGDQMLRLMALSGRL